MMSTVAADEAERRLHYGSNPRNKVREGRQVTTTRTERGKSECCWKEWDPGLSGWPVSLSC